VLDGLPDLHLVQARDYILGTMLFPCSQPDRDRYVRARKNEALRRVVSSTPRRQLPAAVTNEVLDGIMDEGIEAVLRDAQQQTSSGCRKGDISARMLSYALACGEHEPNATSIERTYKKFQDLHASRTPEEIVPGFSRASLAAIWSQYAPVSHLWAAYAFNNYQFGPRGSDLAGFLGCAESLRGMAERITPSHAREPLLADGQAWSVPQKFILPICSFAFPEPAMAEAEMERGVAQHPYRQTRLNAH
jgi:hypothetical protein